MAGTDGSTARERLLGVAARLFSERGYAPVTLRDIAGELGIQQASLYHHVPGGKEELFVEVTERGLDRIRTELEAAINAAQPVLSSQLHAAAQVLLVHPPIDLARMIRSDMPEISGTNAQHLTQHAFVSLLVPLARIFSLARERDEQQLDSEWDPLLAGSFLSIVETIQIGEQFASMSGEAMATTMINVLIDGIRPR